MDYILRVDKLYNDENGRPVETVPQGFVVSEDRALFPYLTSNEKDATPFTTYDDAITFVASNMSESMASKQTPLWEYSISVFEISIHMKKV